jgi:N-acetylneuraminic acid mutarotase
MPSEVVGLTGAAVNGMFYYMGGFFKGSNTNKSNEVYRYDPVADALDFQSRMLVPRDGLGAGVVDGKIYAVGGNRTDGSLSDDVGEYDPTKDN